MAAGTKPICPSNALVNGGCGVRFHVRAGGRTECAFVVRYADTVRAYLNVCAHRSVELDWEQGQFFDIQRHWLICSTHGALYDPATGYCVSGPCQGAALTVIPVNEQNGEVCLIATDSLDLA